MNKKVAYITGGTKGIGYGIAKVLQENGIIVVLSGRQRADAEKAAKDLSDAETPVVGLQSDVKKFEDEQKVIQEIIIQYGRLDYVIANAGIGIFKPVDELSTDDWSAMIDTNLTGVFHTLKASVEELKKSKGYFISVSSLAGTNFFADGSGYNASKFGAVGFTQAAMLDLRKYDIKVSTIMPGSVSTYFNGNQPSEKDAWKIQPEDIGQLVMDIFNMNPRTLPSKIEIRPLKTK